jgi:glycosyltransferase involved in cell wall biosynthesis
MSQDPLHLLCVEPTFPGRLGAVADWLVRRRGYHCQFYCHTVGPQATWPESVGRGLELIRFDVGGVARESGVDWMRVLERGLCYAYGCWEVLDVRRPRPIDIVLGRSRGLGSTLFLPAYQPGLPTVNFFDYYYHPHAHDLTADWAGTMPVEYYHWRRAANALELIELENGIVPWTATRWQRDLFPEEYRQDFVVLYDGVNTRRFQPRRSSSRTIAGRPIASETRVVTFVAQTLEQLRGFDCFVELANRLLRARSDVLCVVIGSGPVQRGLDVHWFNQDYGQQLLQQTPLHDPERFWLLGTVTPEGVAETLAASDLHVYASRPYPLSRSLLEAMASGCVVLAADTDPARELITNGQTGLLVASNDPDAWEQHAKQVLANPAEYRPLGDAAANRVREQYSQEVTLPALAKLLDSL